MSGITTIGLDLAKNVFQLHGADHAGKAVLRKKLRRDQVLPFLSTLASSEAWSDARTRPRDVQRLGGVDPVGLWGHRV